MAATLLFLTIGLPWTGALLVWAAGYLKRDGQLNAPLVHGLAVAFGLAAAAASLGLLAVVGSDTVVRLPMGPWFGDLTFVLDGLGVSLAVIAAVIGELAVIFSVDYMHGDPQLGRYYFLVLLFIGAMCGLVLTSSLLFLFVFWEITALCSYALISYYNDDPKAVAGGIKALIITQLGGVGLLVGALLCYTQTGSFEYRAFFESAAGLSPATLAIIAFGALIAAAAKSAQVPFQTWLPDAMEAPTPISALIHAATMVNAGVYLLARFYPAFAEVPYWREAVVTVGALTALLAALMAMVANDLKRVLAYSTVSQLGYMVYAIGAGSVFAAQFHLLSHAVFKALLFLGAGAVIHAVGTREMRHMGAGRVQMPFVRNVFILGALALAGLPIMNGFWSKELVLEAGLEHGPSWAYWVMLLGAGLTAFYTYRMVWMVFFAPSTAEPKQAEHGLAQHVLPHSTPRAMAVALAPLAFGSLTTWLLAGPFSAMLARSLPQHDMEPETTGQLVIQIITAPATWLALAVIAIGLSTWHFRGRLAFLASALGGLATLARNSFGFEGINAWTVRVTQGSADGLRTLQTGKLNWNLVGIIAGLAATLIWLAWSL
jgi:NADH-quinone oxidoreductase subunit L